MGNVIDPMFSALGNRAYEGNEGGKNWEKGRVEID